MAERKLIVEEFILYNLSLLTRATHLCYVAFPYNDFVMLTLLPTLHQYLLTSVFETSK